MPGLSRARNIYFSLFFFFFAVLTHVQAQNRVPEKTTSALNSLSNAFENLAEFAGPAVVQIFSTAYAPGDGSTTASIITRQSSTGSGVIVDPNGYIVTNAHVVSGAHQVRVLLPTTIERESNITSILKPGGLRVEARIIGVDTETDLAILKIEGSDYPYLAFGDSDLLRQGELVFAFGSPLGLSNSLTMGVISSVARQLEPESPMVYIQTDAPINPGNSGGPLLNSNGEVVGINTLIFSRSGGSDGIGFAAPGNIVRAIYQQLRKNGRVRRGEIGVFPQTISPAIAAGLGLNKQWGVVLSDVVPSGPAAEAGLRPGDVILSLDGKQMENARQFNVNVYQRELGATVALVVQRAGQVLNFQVEVVERPDDPSRFFDMVDPSKNLIPELGILAIDINRRVEEMIPRRRKRFGVLVAATAQDAPTVSLRFQPGDVIYSVNQIEVTGLTSLRQALTSVADAGAIVVHTERRGRLLYVILER